MLLRFMALALLVAINICGSQSQGDPMLFSISKEEKEYLQKIWRMFVKRSHATADVQNATITLFMQTPDLLTIFGYPRGQKEEWDAARQVTRMIIELTNQFFDAILDDRKAEAVIRGVSNKFHAKGVAIEELFLYPAGMIVGNIAAKTENPLSAPIFTRLMFAVSVLLCGPSSPNSFFNLGPQERGLIQQAWIKYSRQNAWIEELIAASFEANPGNRQLAVELDKIPADQLQNNPKFKEWVVRAIAIITKFVRNLDDKLVSTDFIRGAAIKLFEKNLPLMSSLFGAGIVLIGSMKDKLPKEDFSRETETALMKLIYSMYPTISDIETFEIPPEK